MNDRHVALIRAFYDAFAQADFPAMERCYHPQVSFGDPIYQEVDGRDRVMRMWRLQLGVRKGLESAYRDVTADDFSGAARSTARYTFASTGREVVHEIETLFRFEDGLIVRHHDDFDFKRWSRMALGRPQGPVFGWTPMWRKTIRDRATRRLDEFEPS